MRENKAVYFIVNANHKIGAGHLKRCLSLAKKIENFNGIAKILFIGWTIDPVFLNNLNFPYLKFKKSEIISELKFCYNKKEFKNFVFIDSDDKDLNSISFQENCIKNNLKTIYFTINQDYSYKCDFLINTNILALYQNYNISKKTRKLFGPNYFVFNHFFDGIEITPRKKFSNSIFVNFGNADPKKISLLLLECILKLNILKNIEIHLVIGNLGKDTDLIKNRAQLSQSNIKVYSNLLNIKPIMEKCQLAICSLGTTFWELAVLGIPSIIIPSSEREFETSKIMNDLGYAKSLFNNQKFFDSSTSENLENLIMNSNHIAPNFKTLQKTINTSGVDKIISEIFNFKNQL